MPMTASERNRLMRNAKNASKPEPISRESVDYAKRAIITAIGVLIEQTNMIEDRDAMRKQRERIAKLFGPEYEAWLKTVAQYKVNKIPPS